MKIKTENFRRFSSPILSSYVQGHKNSENMYLNFENSCAYFSNESFIAKLKFDFEIEDPSDNDLKNILVDKEMFLALCTEYEELTLDADYNFSYEEESFSIPHFVENQDYPEFNYDDFTSYHLGSGVLRNVRAASQYMGTHDPQEDYFGVNIREDRVVGTDSAQVFEGELKDETEEFPDIKLKGDIVKLVLTISEFEVCYLNYNENTDELYVTFGDNQELDIATTQQDILRMPDVKDEEFISKYHHETYFVVEKTELLDVLDFFQVFVRNERNERLYLHITDENTLSVESQSKSKGNRNVSITDSDSRLVGEGFWIPRALVVKAVRSIEDDFVQFEVDQEAPAFNIVGKTNNERHIATVRLY